MLKWPLPTTLSPCPLLGGWQRTIWWSQLDPTLWCISSPLPPTLSPTPYQPSSPMMPHPSPSLHMITSNGLTSLSMASPPESLLPVGLTPPWSAIRCSSPTTLGIIPSATPSHYPGSDHHPPTAPVLSCPLWLHLRIPLGNLCNHF